MEFPPGPVGCGWMDRWMDERLTCGLEQLIPVTYLEFMNTMVVGSKAPPLPYLL